MSNRIIVNGSLAAGSSVLQFIGSMNDALSKGRRLKAQLDSMSSNSDWDQIATELGLPKPGDTSPANTLAQDAWTIISTALAQIDSAQVAELARLDQG